MTFVRDLVLDRFNTKEGDALVSLSDDDDTEPFFVHVHQHNLHCRMKEFSSFPECPELCAPTVSILDMVFAQVWAQASC